MTLGRFCYQSTSPIDAYSNARRENSIAFLYACTHVYSMSDDPTQVAVQGVDTSHGVLTKYPTPPIHKYLLHSESKHNLVNISI